MAIEWHDTGVWTCESSPVMCRDGRERRATITVEFYGYSIVIEPGPMGTNAVVLSSKDHFNEAKTAAEAWLHQQEGT